ncbi:hypothetical protein AABB24_025209 [Solanum stoloniferum]|uniref:Protein kinase domain-containing protein n=1 Tax=Solanum stoloniferum TaxID=62892 RepID=A0ABD2SS97_9SOLN
MCKPKTEIFQIKTMLSIALVSFLLLHLTVALKPDSFLLSCGAQSGTTDESDGRQWYTDTHDPSLLPSNFSSISSTATAFDTSVTRVPYTSARIFQSPFTYTLPVSPGTKFLRLYFYPSSYLGITKSQSFFSVTANHITLLSNFSAFDATTNSSKAIRKEFVINVNGTKTLKITFSPSPNSYAFVNGIEILPIPTNLYFRGGDHAIKWVGQRNLYYIYNSTALETLYRLNVGGNLVASTGDTGIYRVWAADDKFVVGYDNQTPQFDVNVTYTDEIPAYTAPNIVYTTARELANNSRSLDWKFPLDSGFYYLFRLHFCEIELEMKRLNYRVFNIYIGNQTAEEQVDVIAWTGGWGIPMYRDYVVYVRDKDVQLRKENVWLELQPNMEARAVYDNVILNALEIFKLSDPNGNLAVPYPELRFEGPIPDKKKKRISWHIIVAIIAGVTSAIAVFSILGFLISRRRQNGGRGSGTSVPKSSSLPSDLCRHFLIAEIKNATDNFDEKFVIGYGGFGNVYKGYLDNGTITVAVKRSNPSSNQGVREFQTEIEMLSSKLRHRHLVSLVGYCDDENELILVYDYMANGTLRDHLYNTENTPLPWKKRLDICIGAAKGLYYLHSGTKHTIIHRDVKSTNILLDNNWVAKVSDFGLSKVGSVSGTDITHVSTAVKGSFGYVDPEYYKHQQLTEKSDVYSFGVVLFEVLCGRPAINPNLPSGQVNLAEWACRSCEKRNLEEIIDPNLKGQIASECLSKFAELAYHCLREQGVERPSMGDVVRSLEFALQLQDGADNGCKYPSVPFIIDADANVATNEDHEIVSDLSEVESKSTSNSISGSAKLKNATLFSELMNPVGR